MCGIAGFWRKGDTDADAAEATLQAMANAVSHRGPDSSGVWFEPASGVGLAHRRLAILDLSAAGHQPMHSESGRYVLSFNGEIYNYRALRRELEAARPVSWKGTTDSEVLLAGIEHWGLVPTLQRCLGMFAFAVWDRRERTLQLVRDRLGVKPLSLAFTPAGACFGSELKSLTPFPGFSREIDPAALSAYVERACIPAPLAIYRGSRKVAPGTLLTLRGPTASDVSETRWWSAEDEIAQALANPFQGSLDDATEALDQLLRDSIRLRMVADVPLGAFLSGGIDSSTVVGLMQALSARPVHTFSIGSPAKQYDESVSAAQVAAHLGTHHTALVVTPQMALDAVPLVTRIYDEPFADSSQIPTYLVSKLARQSVTVALSGDGGDELFGGYNRHVWTPRIWRAVRRVPRGLRGRVAEGIQVVSPTRWDELFARAGRLSPSRQPGLHLHKLASILSAGGLEEMYGTLIRQWSAEELLRQPTPWGAEEHAARVGGPSEAMMYQDLMGYLPDDILAKVDRASMAVSLEAREPLLDHRLIAFSWSLPSRYKISGGQGKVVLRKVLDRYVPRSLTDRPKMGFGIPLAGWLRNELKDWAWSLLRPEALARDGLFRPEVVQAYWDAHQSGRRNWEQRLWTVLMFQAWRETGEAQA